MQSRERVLRAIRHQVPDRVPLDLGGVVSGIHIRTYKRVLAALGLEEKHFQFYDFNQQIVTPSNAVLDRLHIDTRYLHPPASLVGENYPLQQLVS